MESGGFQGQKTWEKLTCPVGLVALGGQAGHAAAHVVDGDHPELVIHIRRQAQHGRVDAPRIPGVVVPHSWLEAVLLKLDNVVWEEQEEVGGGFGWEGIFRHRDFGDRGQTCDGAVVVIARDPRQPHAPLSQIRQLQVPGPVRSLCWNGINEAGIVPGASPSSHHLSQPCGQDVLQGTIHILQLFRGLE